MTDKPKTVPGRAGGLVGGKARAAAMTPEARKAQASLAAKVRWANHRRYILMSDADEGK